MFDRVQESLKKSKDDRLKKRLEKERVRLEKAAAEAVREKERLQQEAEKDRLLSLDDKGLMVELILAVRGLYSQMEYIQSQQASLSERVDDIESDISSIRSDISDLESRLGSSDQ